MINLTNGHVQNQAGMAVPNGSISFQLNIDATIIATPYGIIPAEQIVMFQFDDTGDILAPPGQEFAQIYSNAELNPQNEEGLGTYYLVTFYDANGARIQTAPMAWQFTEANGSTVDIGQMTPFSTVGGVVIFYPTSFTINPPGPSTLGGVFSNAGATGMWICSINTNGSVSLSQPAFSDISGTISASQLPNPITFTNIVATGTIQAEEGLLTGTASTTTGTITLYGGTSGSSTITAPAIAGIVGNPILFSNSINIPSAGVFSLNTDTGISRGASAGILDVGNGTSGNASGTLNLSAINASGVITAASLEGLTGQLTPNAAGSIAVGTTALPFSSIWIGSTSAHNAQLTGAFTANRVWTIPDATDTAVGQATAATLTNKTLTSPVLNGTPTGTAIPIATVVSGSGSGNYSSTSTSYVAIDGTNLTYTAVIPVGWKLMIVGTADVGVASASVSVFFSLVDGSSVLIESQNLPAATIATDIRQVTLCDVVAGDGASHTITLQYRTSNAADAVTAVNSSSTLSPHMTLLLMPSV